MARKFTRIKETTFQELQLEAGLILNKFDPNGVTPVEDADIVCATTGGVNPTCIPTYRDDGEDVDNCPTNMAELKALEGWDCKLAFTALSVTAKTIKMSLGAADIKGDGKTITPRSTLDVTKDYTEAIWWVGDLSNGGMAAIKLMKALSTGGFSLQTTKKGKGQLSVELTGHVSIESQDVVPMEFYVSGPEEE